MNLKSKKKYVLHFDEIIANKIHVFGELLFIELNDFVAKTLKPDLIVIEDDITTERYDIVIKYFDLSKLIGIHTHRILDDLNEKKSISEIKFPHLISRAIQKICNTVHWKPEKFIEDIVTRKINDMVKAIKNGKYDFLAAYLDSDLLEIVKLINQIYKKSIKC